MDKKLKKAADGIKMPEDMKERIIKACESAEEKNYSSSGSDSYSEVVSGTERIDTKRNMIRIVSAIAACAVLVSGLGATGVFLHRQRSSQTAVSEAVDDASCRSCPFGDFSTFEYSFDGGDGKYGNYSAETYAKLSDFLNKFSWGSELEEYETRTADQDVVEPFYHIKWTSGNTPPVDCDLHIASDGFVTYQESMMDFETGAQKTINENSRFYKIDFDVFDKEVQNIIALDQEEKPDTLFPFGNFREKEFNFADLDGKVVDRGSGAYEKLADYLNSFDWGERHEFGDTEGELADVKVYLINWDHVYDNGTSKITHHCYLQVAGGDRAYYYCYESVDDSELMHCVDREWHEIDFYEFSKGIKKILAEEAESENEQDFGELSGDLTTEEIYQSIEDDVQEYLKGFSDVKLVVSLRDENDKDIIFSQEISKKLQSFAETEFKYNVMLRTDFDYSGDTERTFKQVYGVDLKYMSGGQEVLGRYYNVMEDGSVILSDCEYDSSGEGTWTGPFPYYLDIEQFYSRLEECGLR